jgi:hypothetical protein
MRDGERGMDLMMVGREIVRRPVLKLDREVRRETVRMRMVARRWLVAMGGSGSWGEPSWRMAWRGWMEGGGGVEVMVVRGIGASRIVWDILKRVLAGGIACSGRETEEQEAEYLSTRCGRASTNA